MTGISSDTKTQFPIWYKDVSIEATDELRSRRLDAIKQLTEEADRDLIEGLVRIVFGVARQLPSEDVIERIQQSFKDADPTFDPASSNREIEVLAGTALVDIFSGSNSLADIAALSVSTASMVKARKLDLPMDLAALADETLDSRSVSARARPDLEKHEKQLSFKVKEAVANDETKAVDQSDLSALAQVTQTALRNIATRQTQVVNSLGQFIKVQDEELQVLWWFIGGRSGEMDCDFDKVPASIRPLIFGKELADETFILPGLRTVKPLMARAGLSAKSKLTIMQMVNSATTAWLKSVMDDDMPSPVTQPLHFAIARRLEVDDDKTWIDGWAGITGLDSKLKIDALTLGELFYREQLLRQFS